MTHLTPELIAFPKLNNQQVKLVGELGTLETFADGDVLIEAGQKEYPFCVIASGEVRIVDLSSGTERDVISHGPGGFVGDVDILTGRPAVISAIARGETRAYIVTAAKVRPLLNEVPELSDLLLEAFQMRRSLLESSAFLGTRVIGLSHSSETAKIREFFYKNHVPHTFQDLGESDGEALLREFNMDVSDTPIIACSGHVESKPSLGKIAGCLGISREIKDHLYDTLIVGAGPAGLAAAVYGASEGLKTLVVDGMGPGGQAGRSSRIENYMGFPSGLSGADLANRGYLQALKFGAEFTAPVMVQSMAVSNNGHHTVELCTGQSIRTKTVLIATGVSYRRLPIEHCERLEGAGIYYSATSVEARMCRESTAIVVGGGNSAGQAAMYLAEHAQHVKLLLRGDNVRKSMSEYLARRIENHSDIEVRHFTEVRELDGNAKLERVTIGSNATGEREVVECSGLFIFVGAKPHTDWLPASVALDKNGFVQTGPSIQNCDMWLLDRIPCELETTCPGVFAAGDVRSGTTKRCAFAAGDGAMAITCVHQHLSRESG